MNFHWPFFALKPRTVTRYYAATRRESRKLQAKREETTQALRRYVTEQKLVAAVDRAVNG